MAFSIVPVRPSGPPRPGSRAIHGILHRHSRHLAPPFTAYRIAIHGILHRNPRHIALQSTAYRNTVAAPEART